MKRRLLLLFSLVLALLLPLTSLAEGLTLRTVSIFAGADAAADTYTRLLKEWEEKTGNRVSDTSTPSNEEWKTGVLLESAAGNEADVLFYFVGTADSAPILSRVVSVAEINAAYPELQLPESELCREADGCRLCHPRPGVLGGSVLQQGSVRPLRAGAAHHLGKAGNRRQGLPRKRHCAHSSLPQRSASLCGGVLPFVLWRRGGSSPAAGIFRGSARQLDGGHGAAAADGAGGLLPGGHGGHHRFRSQPAVPSGKAAMQIDGSWFANSLPADRMDSTVVLPFPSRQGEGSAIIRGVSMGFYLTRKAWNSPRKDAAVHLLSYLATGDNARALGGYGFTGALRESADAMLASHPERLSPVQDAMSPEARTLWFRLIPSLADGRITPEELWRQVFALHPFQRQE